MDPTQLSSAASSSSGIQGAYGGHHHHHKSISQQVDDMSSAIDSAVQAGSMTSDQASALKKELADVTQTLSQAQSTAAGATGATSQTGTMSQLSPADRKKVMGELQDVRKQLHAAYNPQASNAASASGSSAMGNLQNDLFAAIDTNGDGSISQSEFSTFLKNLSSDQSGQNINLSA
jgi:hypothetical protein